MPSISLLIGPNAYAVRKERRRWMQEFRDRHGEENLTRVSCEETPLRDLRNAVAVAPFIASRRLVIVDGIPRFEREDLGKIIGDIHPAVVLVFVDVAPDRRTAFVKELLKVAEVREFPFLSPAHLALWIEEEARKHGAVLTKDARASLLAKVGEDQDVLAVEIAKLAAYTKEIRPEDVLELVLESGERVWWNLTVLLGQGKIEEALVECRRLLRRGESPHALWARLLWIVASLAQVLAAVEDGTSDLAGIAKMTSVKPGTARTLLPLARSMRREDLERILNRFTRDDISVKTGGYRATTDETQEIEALIDRGILAFRGSGSA